MLLELNVHVFGKLDKEATQNIKYILFPLLPYVIVKKVLQTTNYLSP